MNISPKNQSLLTTLALTLAVFLTALPARTADDETASVKEAAMQFYAALNTMFTGDVAPMLEVWSHADDITFMGPQGGLYVGWENVRPQWEAQAALKLGGTIEPDDMHIFVGEDLAVVQDFEKGTNTNVGGETVEVSLRATNIFRKEDGKWKMISHQTDKLSGL